MASATKPVQVHDAQPRCRAGRPLVWPKGALAANSKDPVSPAGDGERRFWIHADDGTLCGPWCERKR